MITKKRERERERENISYNCKPNYKGKKNWCNCIGKESIIIGAAKENSRSWYFS